MPQVTVWRPLGELDLCHELGPKPDAVLHLFLSQSPLGALFLGQIAKRAGVGLQSLEPGCDFTAKLRHKAVSYLGGVEEFLTLVIADYQGVKRISGRVSADDKLLPPVDLVLDPCAGALT